MVLSDDAQDLIFRKARADLGQQLPHPHRLRQVRRGEGPPQAGAERRQPDQGDGSAGLRDHRL
jgi:hypothetical protein